MTKFFLHFFPDNKQVSVKESESIYEAVLRAGIQLNSSCGGKGTCGRCRVKINKGKVKTLTHGNLTAGDQRKRYVLACQSFPLSDLVVEIPDESKLNSTIKIEENLLFETNGSLGEDDYSPLYKKIYLEVPKPTLDDTQDDWGRLARAICKQTGVCSLRPDIKTLRSLPKVLRDADWRVTVSLYEGKEDKTVEIVQVEKGRVSRKYYGLAVDVGTTTVVAHLVDLENGRTVGVKGTYNRQAVFGDDIISRIIYAGEHPEGLKALQKAVVGTINGLVKELAREMKIRQKDIKTAVCAGNTTMTHLLLGIDPAFIRLEPYTPAANSIPAQRAHSIGLKIDPGAKVLCLPGIASYVGGDIVAGVLFTGMALSDELTLFIDIGTNGETVLGNKEWLVSCACSAGPAFEGGGIRHGMRAVKGAIEHLSIDKDSCDVKYTTIGAVPPSGICGSGLIDSIAWMNKAGIIDRNGSFTAGSCKSRVRDSEEGKEFVLARSEESGIHRDITITEPEVKNLLRSKAAVFAGIRSMLKMVGLSFEEIDRVIIAGGFGSNISIRDAISIGMLPDIPLWKYTYVGNSSVKGAKAALLSRQAREYIDDIVKKMTYLELSAGNTFMEEFVSALFIPHTDLSLFPSVKA